MKPQSCCNCSHPTATHSSSTSPSPPAVSEAGLREALHWWAKNLDGLLTETFNPTRYVVNGELDPVAAYRGHLGLEQLFRTAQSISALDRDPVARRALLFDSWTRSKA